MGIFTPSTKQRLEDLENQRRELSLQIAKEELAQPTLARDQIIFWLHRFRKLDTTKLEHRRRLINSFVNAVILYDDHLVFVGNYKDGSKTVTFAELEAAGLGSDLTMLAVPEEEISERISPLLTFWEKGARPHRHLSCRPFPDGNAYESLSAYLKMSRRGGLPLLPVLFN